eukprot:6483855-Amphidinium_carterae.1
MPRCRVVAMVRCSSWGIRWVLSLHWKASASFPRSARCQKLTRVGREAGLANRVNIAEFEMLHQSGSHQRFAASVRASARPSSLRTAQPLGPKTTSKNLRTSKWSWSHPGHPLLLGVQTSLGVTRMRKAPIEHLVANPAVTLVNLNFKVLKSRSFVARSMLYHRSSGGALHAGTVGRCFQCLMGYPMSLSSLASQLVTQVANVSVVVVSSGETDALVPSDASAVPPSAPVRHTTSCISTAGGLVLESLCIVMQGNNLAIGPGNA